MRHLALAALLSAQLLNANPLAQAQVEGQPSAYYYRALDYAKKGDLGPAIADYSKAVELDPKFAPAYNARAWTYFKAAKAAQGLPDVEKSLQLLPDDPGALDTRGHIFEALGRREEAIADFRLALAKAPDLQGSKDALKRLGASP
jgi:tetratricopeptide (TPR) repeat protein